MKAMIETLDGRPMELNLPDPHESGLALCFSEFSKLLTSYRRFRGTANYAPAQVLLDPSEWVAFKETQDLADSVSQFSYADKDGNAVLIVSSR